MLTAYFAFLAQQLSTAEYRRFATEALNPILSEWRIPGTRLYAEQIKVGTVPNQPAFNWGVGVLLPALNDAAAADPRFKPVLGDAIEATRVYWNPKGPVPGYDVLPGPKSVDRYYDDNEWMCLALVDAGTLLHSKKIIGYAQDTFNYVMSGWDPQLGGGIFWHETKKDSKNTCSNGPAAAAALALYQVTNNPQYLKNARDIYAWTKRNLQDPDDGLYWDNISLTGLIEKTKFSYNSGLMLRSAAELYHVTGEESYADDARKLQSASLKHWVSASGALNDGGKFMHLLLENWLRTYREVPGAEDPHAAIEKGLLFLHDSERDSLNHYGEHWDRAATSKPYSPANLVDQAAAVRAFYEAGKG